MAGAIEHKLVLIGDCDVGKTSMFLRFKTGLFHEDIDERTKRDIEVKKTIDVDGQLVELTLHDTAGLERFEGTVPPSYFRHASAVIFVYTLDSQESIANINIWSESVSPQRLDYVHTDVDILRVLAGNKCDLDERLVSKSRAGEVIKNCEIKPEMNFEISALSGEGFEDMFISVAREILSQDKVKSGSGVQLSSSQQPKKSGKGCC